MSNPFRNATNGLYTVALFYEMVNADKSTVSYTLKNHDHEGFPSLKRLYMEAEDTTEYDFAVAHLDGWEHWQKLLQCSWFQPYIESWRKELELKLKARAYKNLMKEAGNTLSKNQFLANKYVIESYDKLASREVKRGRPSKAEVNEEALKLARSEATLEDDFTRAIASRSVGNVVN